MNKKIVGLLLVVISFMLVLTGCLYLYITEDEDCIKENGFVCIKCDSVNDAVLINLDVNGHSAKELVLPKTVCGYKIIHIFDRALCSPHTKKIFVPNNNYTFNSSIVFSQSGLSALKKIILLSCYPKDYSYGFAIQGKEIADKQPYTVFHNIICAKNSKQEFEEAYYMVNFIAANISYYYNYELAENGEDYWMGEAGSIEIMNNEHVKEGYELGGWYTDKEGKNEYDFFASTNRSYMKIYPKWIVPNGGYYWIDDLNEGEKIKTKPADPTRENYNFEGWYTEAECLNAFDFDSFVKGTEDLELYAKWR